MAGSDQDLRNWIIDVRGDESKSSFCEHLYHFQIRQGEPICLTYGRGTITNWESGKTSPPRDVETILSIALTEFDKKHGYDSAGDDRYYFARGRLNEMLGLDLWCRNLHDALLIQVCRGLLRFDGLIEFEKALLAEIKKVTLTSAEKDELAIERKTEAISKSLSKAENLDEVFALITTDYASYFAAQHWLSGSRFRRIYERRNRFFDMTIPLKMAVVNLAPNYTNSINNMFNGSFLSRDWLIDLCRHLRFDRDEINEVLEATHNAELENSEELSDHFSFFCEKPLDERLKIMLLNGLYLADADPNDYPVPIDYLLDPFRPSYESGKTALRKLKDIVDSIDHSEYYGIDELSKKEFATIWSGTVERPFLDELFNYEITKLYAQETPCYFTFNKNQTDYINRFRSDAVRIHYFAALTYTVLTGDVYTGAYHDSDLDGIRALFHSDDVSNQEIHNNIFMFISQILGTFLGPAVPHETEEGKFYVMNAATGRKSSRSLDFETIIEDLWESVLVLSEET